MHNEKFQKQKMTHRGQFFFILQKSIGGWIVPAMLLFALGLRLFKLEYTGLWTDEIGQVQIAENTLIQTILQSVRHTASTPLDYIITHFALYIGKSEGILRLPPVILGVLAVFVIYKTGKQMFDEKTGIIASFLLTILPIHVYYSREVRFYSLATLFALLSLYFFNNAIEKNSRKEWIIFGVIQTLGLYSHYYLLAITSIEAVWLLLEIVLRKLDRKVFLRFLVSSASAVFAFLPWIVYDIRFDGLNGKSVFIAGTGLNFHFPNRNTFLAANLFYDPRFFNNSKWWVIFCLISIITGLVFAFRFRKASHVFISRIFLLALLYLGGIAFLLTMDAFTSYFFASRQILIFTPYLSLLVAAFVVSIVNHFYSDFIHLKSAKTHGFLINGSLLGVVLFSLWSLGPGLLSVYSTDIADWRVIRQGWLGTGQYLTANVRPGDILLTTHTAQASFYAQPINSRIVWLPDDPETVRELAKTHDRVWLLTTGDRIKNYPNIYRFITTKAPLELTLQGSILLYVYSENETSSEILLELLKSDSIAPATMILTGVIDRAISDQYQDAMYAAINKTLQQKDLEGINKSSIATIGGEAFLKQGDLEKATNLIQQAVALAPGNARNWTILGNIFSQRGDLKQAILAYKKSLSIKSDDYWSTYFLAYRLRQLGEWQEALHYAEKALPLAATNNNRADALKQIALIDGYLGNQEQACGAYLKSYQMKEDKLILTEMEKLSCANP